MIRSSRIKIINPNIGKVDILNVLILECQRVINLYIDILWTTNYRVKFVTNKIDDTWLSKRMQQCLGKQALEICKSQIKRKKKTKPVFKKSSINLDSRFVDIKFDQLGEFDTWIKFSSLGDKQIIKVPSICKNHKHLQGLFNDCWKLKKTIRLIKLNNDFYIDLIFEKKEPIKKSIGKSVGFDIGYKKLLVSSNGEKYGENLEQIYEKISRKKQGSRSFKKSLKERDNLINNSVNNIDLENIKDIVVEDLKNVKHKSKFSKRFNNKLQRWSYSKVLNKLQSRCETEGIKLIKINPSYTSQTCSCCGTVDKKSRKGERFKCTKCNMLMDADYNAAINILNLSHSPGSIIYH